MPNPAPAPAPNPQANDVGLSDIMAMLSPAYALSQGKSPFAGGLLGMAVPGMAGTPEQQQLAGMLPFGGLGGLMQPAQQVGAPAQQPAQQSRLGPLAGILPMLAGR